MLNVLRRGVRCFQPETPVAGWRPDPDVVWIDLLNPTREDELAVEAALSVEQRVHRDLRRDVETPRRALQKMPKLDFARRHQRAANHLRHTVITAFDQPEQENAQTE